MKLHVSTLAFALVLLFAASDLASAQGGCSLIDSTKPAQFVSYEMIETSKPTASSKEKVSQAVLRFRNNTNCEVTVVSYRPDPYILSLDRSQGDPPRVVLIGPKDYPDGKRIELKYRVNFDPPLPPSGKKPLGIDEIVYHLNVPAGKSLTFTVPLFNFDHWVTVEVPFRYAWDTDTDRLAHHAIFGNLDLPMEILSKTKSCRLIDWCKPSR